MRKIAAGLFISVEGVVEFPERWGFQYLDNDMSEEIVAGIARADAVLLAQQPFGFLLSGRQCRVINFSRPPVVIAFHQR